MEWGRARPAAAAAVGTALMLSGLLLSRHFLLSSAAPGHRLRRAQAHGLSRRPRIQSRGLRSVAGTGVPLKGHFLAREPGRMFNSNGQRLENHGFSIR